MNIAFFHGLESPPVSDKTEFLEQFDAWCPPMDYYDPKLFDRILNELQNNNTELLVGSSMGGWFAYCLSTLTDIPTLIFNPALNQRTFSPKVYRGDFEPKQTLILGIFDNIIDIDKTEEWLDTNKIENYEIHYEMMGHRTPIDIFTKWVNKTVNEQS